MVLLNWLAAIVTSAGINTGAGGPTEVWLAVLSPTATTCPVGVGGWVLRPPAGTPFERFCAYGFFPSSSTPTPDFGDLEHGSLEGLANAEIGLVRPQQQLASRGPVRPATWPTAMSAVMAPFLWDHFRMQVGLPSVPGSASARPDVRLAIVDTMPDGAPNPNSLHAPTLDALANAMACTSGGKCAVDIKHHLAMPRVEDGAVDLVNGGNYGTLWDLARALRAATRDSIADGFDHLVINLSLGWDPTGQSSLPNNHLGLITGSSNLPAPIRAVHTALVYARCQGALIIAASGNDDVGLEDRTGPLLPAGWMVHDAPTTAQCASLFTSRGGPASIQKAPLVYAVGGVNHLGQALENARPQSTPELVAPASGVAAPTGGAVLTGTSVAALVASTASGLVWAIQKQTGADATLATVKSSAIPLPWNASFCDGPTCLPVRQISLCSAQQSACKGATDCARFSCPRPGTSVEWPPNMLPQAGIHLLNRSPLKPVPMGAPQPVVNCGSVRMPTPNPWTIQPCPLDDPIAARNLDVAPQPLDPMCPTCFLSDQGQVFVGLELVPDIPGGFLHDVYLKVSNGFQDQVFALPGPLPQEHSELIFLSPTGWNSPITKAWLQYVVIKDGQSYFMGEPLIVD